VIRTEIPVSRFPLSSGMCLEYATTGEPSPAAVVFIHGWPDSWRSFEPVLTELSPTRHAVAVSLRGFGGSDAPAQGYAPGDFASDVIELVEGLGITSAVFVGHSMGSVVAQRVALTRPDLVSGLVMVDGFARLEDALADEVWSVVSELTDPLDDAFVREFQASTLAAPVAPALFEQMITESLRAPARVWRDAFDGIRGADLRGEVARIGAPTLLIWGTGDVLIPRSMQELLLSELPEASLAVYEGAGHSPNWEQPQRVAADIEAFLDAITTQGSIKRG
jgi:non-heme chloroperoxidase